MKRDKPYRCQQMVGKYPIYRNQVSRSGGKQAVPKPNRNKPDMAERVQD